MAALNQYVGYGITTLLLWLINKNSNSKDETASKAATLSVGSNETKIGSPIPVIIGRALVKSPIVAYFGDFSAKPYTETYAAHAKFNAWPLVLSLIMQYISAKWTGHSEGEGQQKGGGVVKGGKGGHVDDVKTETKGRTKDDKIGPLIWALFIWLLNWLINGRNLKTTMQKGFKYYLGYQYLISWSGKNMRVRHLYLNEKDVWHGDVSREGQGGAVFSVAIDNEELFGGPDEQGGFVGDLHLYLGGETQGTDPWMVQQMSQATVQAEFRGLTPAYRPFVSMVVPTAYIGKQATIPALWIELQNCPDTLGLGAIGEDANPAEAIYEILTNRDWGLAENPEDIDLEALVAMGEVLKEEGLGISVQLNSLTKGQTLIDTICEHINAARFSDPHTGKLVFKLIRDDYDVSSCLRLDTSNCAQVTFTRLDWSQIVSKVSVDFTAAEAKYEQASVPTQDPAAIEINSGVQTVKSYSYTYFTTAVNALWAAKRELHTQAFPLATVSITGNRQLYDVRIGDVVLLNWKPYGIKNMLIRVTDVDVSKLTEGEIRLEGMEDIWGLAKSEFEYSGSTEWKPEEKFPTGAQDFRYLEMPYELVTDNDTYVAAFAALPSIDTTLWTVWRKPEDGSFESTASLSKWTPTGRLIYGLEEFSAVEDLIGFEISDLGGIKDLPSSVVADIATARQGSRLLLIDDEIIAYSTLLELPNGHWQVKGILRGVCDTVPARHNAMANVFFVSAGTYLLVTGTGPVCRAKTAVTEAYNILTSSITHTEEFDYAKAQTFKTQKRSIRPSVPGRIRMSDRNHAEVYTTEKIAGDLSIHFVPRNNRQSLGMVSQDDAVEYWGKAEFVVEAGTDYLVEITNGEETARFPFDNAPAVVTWEAFCRGIKDLSLTVTAKLYARRDGLLSYQPQQRTFTWTIPTLVDIVPDAAAAMERMKEWGGGDRIVAPAGAMAGEITVMYENMPIFLIGTPSADGIYGHDGKRYAATGDILIVTGKEQYDAYTMQDGFAFNSFYVPAASGGQVQSYAWNGTTIKERT